MTATSCVCSTWQSTRGLHVHSVSRNPHASRARPPACALLAPFSKTKLEAWLARLGGPVRTTVPSICRRFSGPLLERRGKSPPPPLTPTHDHCRGGVRAGPGAKLGDSKAQRSGDDHSLTCYLAVSPESTLLPWKCGAAFIPIPRSRGNGRNVRVTSMVTFEVTVTIRTTAQGRRGCRLPPGDLGGSRSATLHTPDPTQLPPLD